MPSKLNLKHDMAFKSVFGADIKESQIALCSLLRSILKQPVSSVKVMNSELTSEIVHQKHPRMDLLVSFDDGRLANIEMQVVYDSEEFFYRMFYYEIRLASRQVLKEGEPYSNFHLVYQIVITDFIISPEYEELVEQFEQRNWKGQALKYAGQLMQLIFVQLPKVPLMNVKDMSLLEKWSFFLKYFEDEGKQSIIKEVIKKEEGIAMADKIIKYMSQEWIDQLNEEFEQLSINDSIRMENARIKWAREEGLQKGRELGRLEEQRNMIETLSQTMSVGQIAKALQKSTEEIHHILKDCQ